MTARAAALLVIAAALACALRGGPPRVSDASLVVVPAGSPRPRTALAVAFAEIAATQPARVLGLGGRTSLPPDGGMLFVYASAEPRIYWMKDCLIGLDIAFIGGDRRIANVVTLGPGAGLEESAIPKASSARDACYVLEMEPGWFARHGILAGAEVDLSAALAGVVPR